MRGYGPLVLIGTLAAGIAFCRGQQGRQDRLLSHIVTVHSPTGLRPAPEDVYDAAIRESCGTFINFNMAESALSVALICFTAFTVVRAGFVIVPAIRKCLRDGGDGGGGAPAPQAQPPAPNPPTTRSERDARA